MSRDSLFVELREVESQLIGLSPASQSYKNLKERQIEILAATGNFGSRLTGKNKAIIVLDDLEIDGAHIPIYNEIFGALIKSGGLTGVKSGQTIIHFDHEGNFQGIQLSYWPYRRRSK